MASNSEDVYNILNSIDVPALTDSERIRVAQVSATMAAVEVLAAIGDTLRGIETRLAEWPGRD